MGNFQSLLVKPIDNRILACRRSIKRFFLPLGEAESFLLKCAGLKCENVIKNQGSSVASNCGVNCNWIRCASKLNCNS